ncbi:hypothetical protein D3C86_1771620 [compost metagenome]
MQDVGHLHGDALAGLQVGVLLQVTGKGAGQTIQLGVSQGHAHIAERRTVGKFLARALEHLDHRFVGTQVDIVGHAGGTFVAPEIGLHYFYPLPLKVSAPLHPS